MPACSHTIQTFLCMLASQTAARTSGEQARQARQQKGSDLGTNVGVKCYGAAGKYLLPPLTCTMAHLQQHRDRRWLMAAQQSKHGNFSQADTNPRLDLMHICL